MEVVGQFERGGPLTSAGGSFGSVSTPRGQAIVASVSKPRYPRFRRTRLLWKGRDPRGLYVSLNEDTWNRHIAPGHPEAAANRDLVGTTIRDPDRILKSGDRFPEREIYERLCDVKGWAVPRRYFWVVVVDWWRPKEKPWVRNPDLRGAVYTTYASGTPRRGVVTWSRPGNSP